MNVTVRTNQGFDRNSIPTNLLCQISQDGKTGDHLSGAVTACAPNGAAPIMASRARRRIMSS